MLSDKNFSHDLNLIEAEVETVKNAKEGKILDLIHTAVNCLNIHNTHLRYGWSLERWHDAQEKSKATLITPASSVIDCKDPKYKTEY